MASMVDVRNHSAALGNVSIILVEPRHPGNIGMACRAMANFGASDLRLVNPCHHLAPDAIKLAVFAKDLLGRAKVFPDLRSAVADLQLSVATTRRQGRLRGELQMANEIPSLLPGLPHQGRMGLVFGREDAGLTTEEVALCSHTATIPTTAVEGSLNLAQAVLIMLYECFSAQAKQGTANSPPPTVTQGDLEPLFHQMEKVLERIAFLNPARPEGVMGTLRRVHYRARLSPGELSVLRGMWSQLAWSIRNWKGRKRGEG